MGLIRPEDIIMRTDDIMVKWKRTKGQGIVDITLHRKLKMFDPTYIQTVI
jgi:hypothetical protein